MPLSVHPWHLPAWQQLLARREALPHALLLSGRQGIGKLDFARALAQSLACETPAPDGAACGACRSCRWFTTAAHPDYREVCPEAMRTAGGDGEEGAVADSEPAKRKPSQDIRIDDVRALQEFIFLTAHQGRGKTILLHPAETLNVSAANALLKNLEEPPAGTRFLLVAHRPGELPATIRSRCQQVVLPTPSLEAGERWLRAQGVAEPALSLAQAGNAPLLALALNEAAYWQERKALLDGLSGRSETLALAEALRDVAPARLLGWLQRWSYDLLSLCCGGPVRFNPDYRQALARVAATLRATELARYHRRLLAEQRVVSHPLNARLYIEHLLLGYAALLRGGRASGRTVA